MNNEGTKNTEHANFHIDFLFFQTPIDDETEGKYRAKVEKNNQIFFVYIDAEDLLNAESFNEKMLKSIPGGYYRGNDDHLSTLLAVKLENLPVVKALESAFYSPKTGIYTLNKYAIKDGRPYLISNSGKVWVNGKAYAIQKPYNKITITEKLGDDYCWLDDFYTAFGNEGIIALAYYVGILFSTQIRAKQDSYPFLRVSGAPASGKSTLIIFLNTLFGRDDYEGVNYTKITQAAKYRMFSALANYPVVITDEESGSCRPTIEWDELKALYNGNTGIYRAHKSSHLMDNGTFNGGLVVIANRPKNTMSEAMQQRCIDLTLPSHNHSPTSLDAVSRLGRLTSGDISSFLFDLVIHEPDFLDTYFQEDSDLAIPVSDSNPTHTVREMKNYAQLQAILSALGEFSPRHREKFSNALIKL